MEATLAERRIEIGKIAERLAQLEQSPDRSAGA
jgi:hypothetical protein